MSRLEKKCFVASAGAHSVLFLVLALAPLLWVAKPQLPTILPPLNLIPSQLIDGATHGGGSPTAKSMTAPAPAPAVKPLVIPAPPPPQPEAAPPKANVGPAPRIQTLKTHEVFHREAKPQLDESDESSDAKPVKQHKIQLTYHENGASGETSDSDTHAKAEASARAAQARFASGLKGALNAISSGVSSGTPVEVLGAGGAAYANYASWVREFYYQKWSPPPDLADDSATVTATVVILRSGTVKSFHVTTHSRHAALDKSVERLEKLHFIAPFPEGAEDPERTFIIDFRLNATR